MSTWLTNNSLIYKTQIQQRYVGMTLDAGESRDQTIETNLLATGLCQ